MLYNHWCMVSMLSVSSPAGCPYEGMRYYDIARRQCAPCTGTCEEPLVPCPWICRSGCACPTGTVLHEEMCIPTEECPKKGETPSEVIQAYITVTICLSHVCLSQDCHTGLVLTCSLPSLQSVQHRDRSTLMVSTRVFLALVPVSSPM